MKKNTTPVLVIVVMLLTIVAPILFNLYRSEFGLLNFLKDVSISCWLIVFSISWLHHKKVLNESEKEKNYYGSQPSPPHATEAKELFKLRNNAEIKYNNSKASITSLEIATLCAGIIAGVISTLAYFK
jgi:hypothetical protein